jgi:serine/threonine protein kinase
MEAMGTKEFMAPEVYRFKWDIKQDFIEVAPAQDIYSLGCTLEWVLYHSPSLLKCVLANHPPPAPADSPTYVDLRRELEEDDRKAVLRKVINAFCSEKAKDRPTARQALQLVDELLGGWCSTGPFSDDGGP